MLQQTLFTQWLLPFLGGILFSLSFPFSNEHHLFFLAPIGMLLYTMQLSLFNNKKDLRSDLSAFISFSFGHAIFGYYWIPETIRIFGSIHSPYNYLIGVLFAFIVMPQHLMLILSHSFLKKFILKKSFYIGNASRNNFIFAICFSLFEYYTPQQFPTHLGHLWLGLSPNLGLAPYFGVIGFSFISYLLIFSLISTILKGKKDLLAPALFILFFSLNIFIPLQNKLESDKNINIRLVQANVGSFLKIGAERGGVDDFQEIISRYHSLSTAPSTFKLDLIVWPETAYPSTIYSELAKDKPEMLPATVKKVVSTMDTPLLFGGYDVSLNKKIKHYKSEYNTAFLIGKDGTLKNLYHKIKLIPFGEGLPFGPLNDYLKDIITNISYFAQGTKYTLFEIKDKFSFISAICYEILFPEFIRDYLNNLKKQPNFLLNLTNDSWYGDTSEPHQHLFLSKWRALEFSIPLVRITNTGITTVIYPDGSETKRLGPYQINKLDIQLKVKSDPIKTIYQRFGILSLVLLWITIGIPLLIFTRRKKSNLLFS